MKKFSVWLLLGLSMIYSIGKSQTWKQVPLYGGYGTVVQQSGGIAYLGTDAGEVYTSSNGGLNWAHLNNLPNPFSISYLSFSGSNIIYGSIYQTAYRFSSNAGSSWVAGNFPFSTYCTFIQNGTYYSGNTQGVYASSNGTAWTAVNSGISIYTVHSLAGDGSNMYAGSSTGQVLVSSNQGTSWTVTNPGGHKNISGIATSGTNIVAISADSVFLSSNAGSTWSLIYKGFGSTYNNAGVAINGSNILLSISSYSSPNVMMASGNTGASWTSVSASFFNANPNEPVSIDASNGNVLVGTYLSAVSRSTNYCSTMTIANTGVSALIITDIKRAGRNILVSTSTNGLFSSTDNGLTWTNGFLGLNQATVYGMDISNPTWWVGDKDGIYMSTNQGATWTKNTKSPISSYCTFISGSGNNIVANSNVGTPQTCYSPDGGVTWTTLASIGNGQCFALCKNDQGVLYIDISQGVRKSVDYGANWSILNFSIAGSGAGDITAFQNTLIGTSSLYYKYSTDLGATSSNLTTLPFTFVKKFMRTDSTLFATTGSNIYMSNTYGKSWNQILPLLTAQTSSTQNSLAMFGDTLWVGTGGSGIWTLKTGATIKGTVFHNAVPVNGGYVKLYKDKHFHMSKVIDSMLVTSAGNYSFTNLVPGTYYVLADYTTALPNTVPTYCDSVYYWDSCSVHPLIVDTTVINKNVYLINRPVNTGTGTISGTVSQGPGYGSRYNQANASGNPISNIGVSLGKKPGGSIIAQTQTNASGIYAFANIPVGTYSVKVDIPGLHMDSVYTVTVGSGTTITGLDYVADSAEIKASPSSLGIHEHAILEALQIDLFPNPSQDNFTLRSSNILGPVVIFDALGKEVYRVIAHSEQEIITTSFLAQGFYVVNVRGRNLRLIKE